jgi:hypothetical protein
MGRSAVWLRPGTFKLTDELTSSASATFQIASAPSARVQIPPQKGLALSATLTTDSYQQDSPRNYVKQRKS